MLGRLQEKIFKGRAQTVIHHLNPVPFKNAQGLLREVYHHMNRDFSFVPPITLHSEIPELTAAVWSIVREATVCGPVNRTERESVIAAVSRTNTCTFCVDVHTTMMHGGDLHSAADAIIDGKEGSIGNERLRNLVKWGLNTLDPQAEILKKSPFDRKEAPFFVGSALTFHYINRVVNVFLDESPLVLLPDFLRKYRKKLNRFAGGIIGKNVISRQVSPGESLNFLPKKGLAEGASWTGGNQHISKAFSGLSFVISNLAEEHLPGLVIKLSKEKIEAWHGESLGLSGAWVDQDVAGLSSDREKKLAKIVLLSALASYQVGEDLLCEIEEKFSSRALLVAVSFGSYLAMKRISSWIHLVK